MKTLISVLGLQPREMVGLTGGGGKTSTMFRLGEELSEAGNKVILTTSTKIFPPSQQQCKQIITEAQCQALFEKISLALRYDPMVCVCTKIGEENKLIGLSTGCLNFLKQQNIADCIIFEADGSRGKPIKAPADHEPVIASECTMVIGVIGLDALYSPLNESTVHRADLFSEITGCPMNKPLSAEAIATILRYPQGIFKGAPTGARKVCLINKVDAETDLPAARSIAELLKEADIERVLLCSLKQKNPVWEVWG